MVGSTVGSAAASAGFSLVSSEKSGEIRDAGVDTRGDGTKAATLVNDDAQMAVRAAVCTFMVTSGFGLWTLGDERFLREDERDLNFMRQIGREKIRWAACLPATGTPSPLPALSIYHQSPINVNDQRVHHHQNQNQKS